MRSINYKYHLLLIIIFICSILSRNIAVNGWSSGSAFTLLASLLRFMISPITKPDPRGKAGPFEVLRREIQSCKVNSTHCPSLKTRQFYFEPNSVTASSWKKDDCFSDHIDYRVMFICESPGGSAKEGNPEEVERCFGSPKDRFLKVRKEYGLANCYITNTVKCGVRPEGGKHSRSEVEACREFLLREIDLIGPMIIVGVGGNAFQTLRTEILGNLKIAPILCQITHYSSRRNVWDTWKNEFPALLRLLHHTEKSMNMKLSDKPLKIESDICGTRIVANLFNVGDRYIFLDIGWTDASMNPFHWIGRLISVDKGKWVFQDDTYADEEPEPRVYTVTEITDKDKNDYGEFLLEQANFWKKYCKDKGFDEAAAKEAVRREFNLDVDMPVREG